MRHRLTLICAALCAACAPERPSDTARARQEVTDTEAARAESARKLVVAEVAGESFTREELERRIDALSPALRSRYASTQQRQELLPTLASFEVLADEAERQGLGDAAQVREAIREELAYHYVEAALRERVPLDAIDEAALRAAYDARPELSQRPARRHVAAIEAATQAELDALLGRWRATPAPDTAARILELRKLSARYSTDRAAADKGGDIGWFEPASAATPDAERAWLDAVAQLQAPGDATPPVQLASGMWRAGVLMAMEPARVVPFEQLKTELRDTLFEQRRDAARLELVREALARHTVKLNASGIAAARAPEPPLEAPPEPLEWLLAPPPTRRAE